MEKNNNKKQVKILVIFIIISLIIDQITKIIFYKNKMVQTATPSDSNGYYIVISIIIVLMIIRYITSNNIYITFKTKMLLSFAISGAIGNVIDRIWNGNVIEFIKFGNSINLNLAYIYILIAWIGMAMILAKNSVKFLKKSRLLHTNTQMFNEEKNNSKKVKNENSKK